VASPLHLARRFFGSLSRRPPAAGDEAWAEAHLGEREQLVWRSLSNPDRRHAIGVARRVSAALDGDDTPREVVAAALLHDAGKVASGLGTFGRVGATVWATARGRDRATRAGGAVGRYLRHPEIGADLLTRAGSDPTTIAWAGEHHRPPETWTVPPRYAHALKEADDD
jgi:hypothetical protein